MPRETDTPTFRDQDARRSSHRSRSRSRERRRDGNDDIGRRRERYSRSRSPIRRRSRSRSLGRRRYDEEEIRHSRRRSRSHSRNSRDSMRRNVHRSGSRSHSHGRSRSRSKTRRHEREKMKRRRSRSSSSSSSGSDKDQHERKKDKRKRSRDRKERKKDKKDKKKKKSKLKGDKGAVGDNWGKYGIISESDMYSKDAEFRAWLVEERMINPENMSKDQTKKEFAKFAEDYNTATLPIEKYYNIDQYSREMAMLRGGETLPPKDETYDLNKDIAAHASRLKRPASERESYLSKEELKDLRRVQQERVEIGKRKALGLEVKSSMGVRMERGPMDLDEY